jgi:biotin carboxyl carrier protein
MSKLAVTIDGTTYEVVVDVANQNGSGFAVTVNGQPLQVDIPDLEAPLEEMDWIVVDGRPYEITFDRDLHWIKAYNAIHRVEVRDQETQVARPHSGDGRIKAPIPGLIAHVMVEPGQHVQAGDPLLVLEAMKMGNEIRAQRAGVVHALHVQPGQSVTRHEVLVEIM